jgi:hypothetical protein
MVAKAIKIKIKIKANQVSAQLAPLPTLNLAGVALLMPS